MRQRISCPHCGSDRSTAREAVFHNDVVYRRRQCDHALCRKHYSTGEILLPEGVRPQYRGTKVRRDEGAMLALQEALTARGEPKKERVVKPPKRTRATPKTTDRILEFLRERGGAKRWEIDRAMQPLAVYTISQALYALKRLGKVSRESGVYTVESE